MEFPCLEVFVRHFGVEVAQLGFRIKWTGETPRVQMLEIDSPAYESLSPTLSSLFSIALGPFRPYPTENEGFEVENERFSFVLVFNRFSFMKS